MAPKHPLDPMTPDELRQAQQDLLEESHNYFGTFFAWEEEALDNFTSFILGESDILEV